MNRKDTPVELCGKDGVYRMLTMKQYDEGGLEGLARADAEIQNVLPEGVDRTEESYKREILKLRIENERLKKSYAVQTNADGEREYVRLKPKSSK